MEHRRRNGSNVQESRNEAVNATEGTMSPGGRNNGRGNVEPRFAKARILVPEESLGDFEVFGIQRISNLNPEA